MILILSTCQNKLSEPEFVRPIEKLVSSCKINFKTRHYLQDFEESDYDKIIICGTALEDFEYLNRPERFSWVRNYEGSVLGICSGAQIIASAFGAELKDETVIGTRDVEIKNENKLASGKFKSYFLISKKPVLSDALIPLDKDSFVMKVKEKEIYGLLFHPEVLNQEIVAMFCVPH